MATSTVKATKIGVFATHEAADRVIEDLKKEGYKVDQIGLVGKNAQGITVKVDGGGNNHAGEGMAIGAAAGAAGGTAIGVGILAGVIPVVGPVLALGTIGTVLFNAIGGAAAAGLAGALIGWGIPEQDAKYYEDEVKSGRFLVTVDREDRADQTRLIFNRHGGYDRDTTSLT